MNHYPPNFEKTQAHKTDPKSNNENHKNVNNDRFSSVKNSLQTCMGFMDGLCCASLNHVSADDREERSRAHLRDFMASYDLAYLNSNLGEAHSTAGSSSSSSDVQSRSSEHQHSMTPASKQESSFPSTEKGTTSYQQSASSAAMMHTVLPNSMLPRDYGHLPPSPTIQEDHQQDDVSCCHSFSQFHGMDDYAGCQHDSSYTQPHTLPSADTYTTVSMSQSYSTMMWDDDDDEEDEEEISSDYILSPVESVFRKDENMEEASMERDGPPSCAPSSCSLPSASIATKTHEAYQYLLRMKPQNYLHGSGSSEDLEYRGSSREFELDYRASNNNNEFLQ